MGNQVTNYLWPAIKWCLLKWWKKRPSDRAPREFCEHHHHGCYVCPEAHCIGALNDQKDLDIAKPRLHPSGYCIHASTAGRAVIFRCSMKKTNEYFARLSAKKGEPVYLEREVKPEAMAAVENYKIPAFLQPQKKWWQRR